MTPTHFSPGPVRVLAISGSLRAGSHNTAILRAAAELAPAGVEVELFDGLDRIPAYNEDHDGPAPDLGVARLRDRIAGADAVLFATPEYNGSVPGQLKNAIDWASRPRGSSALAGKAAAVIGASPGQYGARWAQADLRRMLGVAGANVLGTELAIDRSHERIGAAGELLDGETRAGLIALLEQLSAHRDRAAVAA